MLAILLAVTLTACGEAKKNYEKADPAEATLLAKKIEKSIAEKDASLMNDLMDIKEMEARSMDGLDISSRDRRDISKGFEQKMKMGTQVVNSVTGEDDAYQYLRTREKNGKTHILFILNSAMGGINYHDILVERDPSTEKLSITDIFIFASGEYLSKTLRDLIKTILKQMEGGSGDVNKLNEFQQAAQSQRSFATVERKYQDLPADLKANKAVMLLRTMAAGDGDEGVYNDVLAEFEAAFPNDPSLDLMMLDKTYLDERWGDMVGHLEDLAEALGGYDSQLLALKSVAHIGEEKYEEAVKAANSSLEMGENYTARTFLFMAHFMMENWDEAIKGYDYLINTGGEKPEDLEMEGFEAFAASEAYKAWEAKQQ